MISYTELDEEWGQVTRTHAAFGNRKLTIQSLHVIRATVGSARSRMYTPIPGSRSGLEGSQSQSQHGSSLRGRANLPTRFWCGRSQRNPIKYDILRLIYHSQLGR